KLLARVAVVVARRRGVARGLRQCSWQEARHATASCRRGLHEFNETDSPIKNESNAATVEGSRGDRPADTDSTVGNRLVDGRFDVTDLETDMVQGGALLERTTHRRFSGKWLDQLQARLILAGREGLDVDTLRLVGHYFRNRLEPEKAAIARPVCVNAVDDNSDVVNFHRPVKSTPMAIVIQPYTGEHVR